MRGCRYPKNHAERDRRYRAGDIDNSNHSNVQTVQLASCSKRSSRSIASLFQLFNGSRWPAGQLGVESMRENTVNGEIESSRKERWACGEYIIVLRSGAPIVARQRHAGPQRTS